MTRLVGHTRGGQQPEAYDIEELDNRDERATWIWLAGTATPSFVEIDPFEIVKNVFENLEPEERDRVWEELQFMVFGA